MNVTYREVGEDYVDKIKRWVTGESPDSDDIRGFPTLLDLYQSFTPTTAVYPNDAEEIYLLTGLVGEVGELMSLYAKWHRKDGGDEQEFVRKVKAEIGDIMWFLSQICNYEGLSLKQILIENRDKLTDRQNRGVIKGSGDDR